MKEGSPMPISDRDGFEQCLPKDFMRSEEGSVWLTSC